jgi:polyvinyl alcohol dehydrogenase (cytochrome)
MNRVCVRSLVCALMMVAVRSGDASAQAVSGIASFETYCGSCHNTPAAGSRAPDRTALSQRTPESILEAITTGAMAINAEGLNPAQKRVLAEQLTLRPIGSAEAGSLERMQNHCAAKPMSDPSKGPSWNGWSAEAGNTRFQNASGAGLTAAQVPNLKLKWAFGFPNGASAFGQPAVAGGRVFIGSDNGFVYAIDAASGCGYWSFQTDGSVRTAISIGSIGTAALPRYAAYFGDLKGYVYAVDADSGALVWKKRADTHPMTRITGAPTLDNGRLYVPLSSLEEGSGGNPRYECCTFRGGVVAYNATTGDEIWRTYTIPSPPKALKKNSQGTQLYGPAGAAVWSSPTVDTRRGLIYVATGNAYNDPFAESSDAVMAFDLRTGRLRWSKQVLAKDTYVIGCGANAPTRDNCPILRQLPSGGTVITIGQKSGAAWGLDPDKEGAVLWTHKVGQGSALGGMEWGSAADEQYGYFPIADAQFGPAAAGGLHALRLTTGEEVWRWKPAAAECPDPARPCVQANSAAISVIPGVVFAGATNGMMRAHATADGKVLWQVNTAQDYNTVNGVSAKGGSINGPGPVIAGGMVLTNSGYSYLGTGLPGNVLLAFTPQ